jgi:hypothetical protein
MTGAEMHIALLEVLTLPGLLELFAKGFFICMLGLFVLHDFSLSAAAVKHRIVLGTLISLALLPLLAWLAPSWNLPILRGSDSPESASLPPGAMIFLWTYVLVVVVLGSRLLLQIVSIGLISVRANNASGAWHQCLDPSIEQRSVTLKLSTEIYGPLTWGALKPTIVLPLSEEQWSHNDRKMILQHEMAHIRRGDWLAMLLARWVCILYWPVPGLRRLLKSLSLSAEQACDDRVLAEGADASDYASLLLKQVRQEQIPATLALAQPAEITVRIHYLVREIVDRSTLDPSRRWLYPVCALLVLPLSTLSLVEKPAAMRLLPLHRIQPMEAPSQSQHALRLSAPILRPSPPGVVQSPPPALPQPALIERAGEKPSIPPP